MTLLPFKVMTTFVFRYFLTYSVQEGVYTSYLNTPFASEQNFPVVMFILLYEVLTFESRDKILWCDYSMETFSQHFYMLLSILQYFTKRKLGNFFLTKYTHSR